MEADGDEDARARVVAGRSCERQLQQKAEETIVTGDSNTGTMASEGVLEAVQWMELMVLVMSGCWR